MKKGRVEQKSKDNNPELRSSRALRDLIILIVVSIAVFVLSYFFDVFVFIVRFLERHPKRIVYVDEVVTALLTLSITSAIFAWRRWLELKKETAKRIRLQEEIIKIAQTSAEVERIIGKQLRCEIELRRQEENALSPKPNLKHKPPVT
jgi:hypothetical protein